MSRDIDLPSADKDREVLARVSIAFCREFSRIRGRKYSHVTKVTKASEGCVGATKWKGIDWVASS